MFFSRTASIIIVWWTIWAMIHFWLVGSAGFGVEISIRESIFSTFLLAAFSWAVSFPVRYYRPRDFRIIFLAVWALILSIAWSQFTTFFLKINLTDTDYSVFIARSYRIRVVVGFIVLSSFIAIGYLIQHTRSLQEEETYRLKLEKQSKDAELNSLRQQLQPHFLFNTLNSINSLIGSKPEQAREMTRKLSEFLRGTLSVSLSETNPLKEEIEHLKLYLDIEKVRFGNRLKTSFNFAEEDLKIIVPRLLLQPLVENAIKFGLYDTLDQVEISLIGNRMDGLLHISIKNPYDKETTYPYKGTGFGISSVKRKLHLLFNRNDLLEMNAENNIFSLTIKIPISQ